MTALELLPPMLREVNGVLSLCVDGSALSEIHRCPRAAYYRLIRRRISSREDKSLTFGKVCAAAWEWRYKRYGNQPVPECDQHLQDEVIDRAWDEVEKAQIADVIIEAALDGDNSKVEALLGGDPLNGAGIETTDKKAYLHAGRCKDVMKLYNMQYPEEPFDVVATERSFATPLGKVSIALSDDPYECSIPVIWEGRYDMVVRNDYGEWIVDGKTTSKFGEYGDSDPWKEWRNSSALKGYCFHRWRETGALPFGWIVQLAIVRPPLQRITAKSLPRNQFERQEFALGDYAEKVLTEWQRNTLATVQTFVRYAEDEYFPTHDRNGFSCKWCSYIPLCTEPDDKTREMLLERSVSFKENTWTPHKVTTQ